MNRREGCEKLINPSLGCGEGYSSDHFQDIRKQEILPEKAINIKLNYSTVPLLVDRYIILIHHLSQEEIQ